MIEVVQSVAALIVTLSILVTFHEFGHYWVARRCGVHVLRFSVGFGKPFFIRRGKAVQVPPPPDGQSIQTRSNEPLPPTEFAIAAIPLGGYVRMLDEREGYVADDVKHLAFNNKPVSQRIAIVAAGPLANFLLAIVAFWLLFTVGVTGIVPTLGNIDPLSPAGRAGLHEGQEIIAVDGVATETWSDVNMQLFERLGDTGIIHVKARASQGIGAETDHQISVVDWMAGADEPRPTANLGLMLAYPHIPAVIGGVIEGEPAAIAGLVAGDHVTAANGISIEDWGHLVSIIQDNPGSPIELVVTREHSSLTLTATPRAMDRDGETVGYLGASREAVALPSEMQREIRYPFYSAWIPALERTWSVTLFTLDSVKKMIVGAISHKNLSGPITIAQVANETAQSGLESFVGFIALLSISLGVLNLLPIPILDGGHLLYYLFELLTGRPVPERVQSWGLQMGLFVIVSIMLLAFYNDITRL